MTHAKGHDSKGKRDNPTRWAKLDAEARATKGMPPSGTAAAPALSPDLEAFRAKYGLAGGMAGAMAADPDDPWVNVSRTTPNPDQFGPGVPLKVPQRKKLSEVLRDFYKLKGPDLTRVQAQLFQGGFYAGDIDFEDINEGVQGDEDTFNAFQRAVGRAAAFSDAGEDVTLDDVLATASPRAGKSGAKGRQRGTTVLSNPDTITRGVEKIAKEVLGHKLSDSQRQAFVGLWQNLESQYAAQSEALAAGGGGGTVVEPPKFEDAAEDYAEKADPQRAFRQDAISGMKEFYSLLGASDG